VPVDDELHIETNPHLDQHFLRNPVKLALLIDAAGIQPADHVVEAGAGIGTVAEHVPVCQSSRPARALHPMPCSRNPPPWWFSPRARTRRHAHVCIHGRASCRGDGIRERCLFCNRLIHPMGSSTSRPVALNRLVRMPSCRTPCVDYAISIRGLSTSTLPAQRSTSPHVCRPLVP
jgi:hypothetical protein